MRKVIRSEVLPVRVRMDELDGAGGVAVEGVEDGSGVGVGEGDGPYRRDVADAGGAAQC